MFGCAVIVSVLAEDSGERRETQKRNSVWEAEQVIVFENEMQRHADLPFLSQECCVTEESLRHGETNQPATLRQ